MIAIPNERLRERAREKVMGLELAVTQTAFSYSRAELEEELELARIALASLEAEMVSSGYFSIPEPATLTNISQLCPLDVNLSQTDFATGWNDCRQHALVHDGIPPIIKGVHAVAQGWNACRAAMQGKAEPVAKDFDNQVLSDIYHAQEKRLFKLAQRIKGPSFDKYAYSPSQAIDVLEAAIFGEDETDNSAMLAAAPQQELKP